MPGGLMNLLSFCWKPFGHEKRNRETNGVLGGSSGGSKEGTRGPEPDRVRPIRNFRRDLRWARRTRDGSLRLRSPVQALSRLCVYAAIAAESQGVVTAETIQRAFRQTEEGFTALVSESWSTRPNMATVGTCCLVGVIHQQTLFIANLGDSRVVLGKKVGNTGGVAAMQLSTEHNANIAGIRQELKELHPHDPQIVVLKHGVWRVKGIIQVSRSIGDVYMKHARYNREPINGKFRLPEPMHMPILSASPTIISHALQPNDSFLIFASDGLWEHLSNEKAVDIVHSHPRAGSAKRLVKAALQEAARKREMRYSDLRKIDKKVRRHFHDDITVIVLFFNHDLVSRGAVQDPPVSIRSAVEHR
ncbi:hypothetical protein V6N13_022839 [Hibiscus sabdariffa]|uniref:PPM-type phosphatase domain-containing protein n=1 Tax=Hibiscus sabdariffa TaxID=183260 RepID=A0ABR2BD00_9ROSI